MQMMEMTMTNDAIVTSGETDADAQIINLPSERLAEAVDVLARSFHDDPNHVDLFPNESVRARALPNEFAAACRDGLDAGHVYAAIHGDELVGVAVWLPPWMFPHSLRRLLRTVPDMVRLLAVAPWSVRRLRQFTTGMATLHPPQPYWYLEVVGVDPAMQGRGIGTQLLDPILTQADETGRLCYLETASERNVAWYRGFGFEVREAGISVTPEGPPNWTMLRQPKGW